MTRTKELKMTDKELSYLREVTLEEELACAKLDKAKAELNSLLLRQKILGHDIKDKNLEIIELQRSLENQVAVRRESLKTIEKKHKLAAGWGYDPISGEIKEG